MRELKVAKMQVLVNAFGYERYGIKQIKGERESYVYGEEKSKDMDREGRTGGDDVEDGKCARVRGGGLSE